MILHFGVIEQTYAHEPPAKPSKRPRKAVAPVTTHDVSRFLEAKYHVMRNFFEMNDTKVVGYLEDGLRDSLEALLTGAPPPTDPFAGGTSQIEAAFKDFLSRAEMESIGYPGVPTKAALLGLSSRFKSKRSGRRPSFIDTGLYQASFKAWVD